MADLLGRERVALQAVSAGMPGHIGALRVDEEVAVALADGTCSGQLLLWWLREGGREDGNGGKGA